MSGEFCCEDDHNWIAPPTAAPTNAPSPPPGVDPTPAPTPLVGDLASNEELNDAMCPLNCDNQGVCKPHLSIWQSSVAPYDPMDVDFGTTDTVRIQ